MNTYKVSCSFGELIDKYTILKIKFDKIKDPDKNQNIKNEIFCLEKEFPIIKAIDPLFQQQIPRLDRLSPVHRFYQGPILSAHYQGADLVELLSD